MPANGKKPKKVYRNRTNVARAMGLTPFGAKKREKPTDMPSVAGNPTPAMAAAASATPMLTEHAVQPGVDTRVQHVVLGNPVMNGSGKLRTAVS